MVQVATYITDKKDTTGTETAVSADEFALFHKSDYRERKLTAERRGSSLFVLFFLVNHIRPSKVDWFKLDPRH